VICIHENGREDIGSIKGTEGVRALWLLGELGVKGWIGGLDNESKCIRSECFLFPSLESLEANRLLPPLV
jgi:hypothetical protein